MSFSDTQATGVLTNGKGLGTIVLAGAVSKGDALGYSGGWKRALATAGSVVQMRCIAAEDGVDGQSISVYFDSVIIDNRFTGGTAGAALYVAEGSDNGKYTETAPSTSSDATTKVGYVVSATEAVLAPNHNVDSVA